MTQETTSPDGGVPHCVAMLRRLSARDLAAVEAHFLALPAEDRRARFCHSVSDRILRDYAARLMSGRVILIGAFVDGALIAVGELHLPRGPAREGEIAISVAPAFRERGIGRALAEMLCSHARNRLLRAARIVCLRDNAAMTRIGRHLGAELSSDPGELSGVLAIALPGYASMLDEAALARRICLRIPAA